MASFPRNYLILPLGAGRVKQMKGAGELEGRGFNTQHPLLRTYDQGHHHRHVQQVADRESHGSNSAGEIVSREQDEESQPYPQGCHP